MTAVANPPSFQQISRPQWGANGGQGGISAMNPDEVARMFMPRKSAQRANSSSSVASNTSSSSISTSTITQTAPQTNGASMPVTGDASGWSTAGPRKKPQRAGPWPSNKSDSVLGVTTTRPQSILSTNGASAASSMSSIQQSSVVPSQQFLQTPSQQQNGARQLSQTTGDGNPVLYLLSMNGTFERKTISVPYYPDVLRIGRQTNAKTVPTPTNGFFDSKVLSRQHAEIWGDRNGKVWIRDVRSSNGTFVNGARLSAENRDSEPHELQSQDHLELGIDIVSEDQKTVVHHKVAAKVEHAGFLGTSTNVLDMNFGDLDPANGVLILPSQTGIQLRGRTSSQGSIGSNGRIGPPGSIATSNISLGQQRPMNFWLTPVTTEQIVKRITHEMRTAKLQTNDLGRTETFFDHLLSKEGVKEVEKSNSSDMTKLTQLNGSPFKPEGKSRFSEPPAPPPQQPLPEKPQVIRTQGLDQTSPSLKRSSTERPRSVPNISPIRQEPISQIITLVEALATTKKEMESQSARIRDLEDMLQREREARETAESVAKRFELESAGTRMNGAVKGRVEGRIIEEAFEPPPEVLDEISDSNVAREPSPSTESVEASTTKLQQRLEMMMVEMREMKQQMESYRQRAESAESERDTDRKTLAEMVEKIRSDNQAKQTTFSDPTGSRSIDPRGTTIENTEKSDKISGSALDSLSRNTGLRNGKPIDFTNTGVQESPMAIALSHPPGSHDHLLYHSTPYASMLGVVLIGMGLMAYMNGWQKVER